MAFPTSLDDFTPKVDDINDVMAVDINELQTAIEALEAKVGIDGSTVVTSLEYRLTNFLPATPSNPEMMFLNGNKTWSIISIGSGGYAANVYPSETASDVSGYKTLSYELDAAETEKSIVVNNNTVLSETYLYGAAVGVTLIPSGVWKANFYAKVNSTIGDTALKAQIFLRHADNSETDLFEITSTTIENTASYLKIANFESSQSAITCLETDRIGVRIKGATTRTSDTTINYIVGDGSGAYFTTPLQIRHDQIRARDAANSHPASAITNTPAGSIAATNVQAALNELDTEKAALAGATFTGAISATNLAGVNSGDEDNVSIGYLINIATEKTTPVNTDMVGLMDSFGSSVLKKLSWTNIKATLKSYFDTIYITATSFNTLTNKRKQPRVYSTTSTTSLSPEIDTYDIFHITALAGAITINNHSTSTPADGELMEIRLLDNGTARAISFGTNYVAKAGVALPTTTVVSKNLVMLFEWNANLSKWNLLATGQE